MERPAINVVWGEGVGVGGGGGGEVGGKEGWTCGKEVPATLVSRRCGYGSPMKMMMKK